MFLRKILEALKEQQELESQKIADAKERRNRERIEFVDRAIIRKQIAEAFEKLPDWQNVYGASVTFEETDMCGGFVYRVAKRNVEKHLSIAVCAEITDTLNSTLRQMRFEACESVNYAYEDALYTIQSVLASLSLRADWDSPEVQSKFQSQRSIACSRYALAYKTHSPFLVLLQVTGIEDAGNYLMLSVKVSDETEYYRWHPQALPFC